MAAPIANEVLELIKSALKEHSEKAELGRKETDEIIKTLKTNLDQLQEKYVKLQDQYADNKLSADDSGAKFIGFTDVVKAKEFVELSRNIFLGNRTKDMTEGVDADGGYLVPEEFRATLLRLIETYGIVRQGATKIPMIRPDLTFPRLISGIPVSWPDEGTVIPTSIPVFGNLKMSAKKMAAVVPVTSELLEDSSIQLANLILTLFAESIAAEEDRVGLNGSTVAGDPFDGVLYDADVPKLVMAAGNTAFTDVTADDLSDMIAQLPSVAQSGAKFYIHRTVFNVIRKLKNIDGDYIYSQPGGDQPGMIWGFPYELCDSMPSITDTAISTPFIFLGNLKYLFLGDLRKMTIAQSQHVKFLEDKTVLRVTERVSIKVGQPQGFVVLVTAAA